MQTISDSILVVQYCYLYKLETAAADAHDIQCGHVNLQ